MGTVSREHIADSLEGAFSNASHLTATDLVEYASDHGAPAGVIRVLGRLHRDNYCTLRDLWAELADVPVER